MNLPASLDFLSSFKSSEQAGERNEVLEQSERSFSSLMNLLDSVPINSLVQKTGLDFVPGSSPVTTREISLETDPIGSPERKVLAEKEDSRWGRKRTRFSKKKMNKALRVEEQAYAPWTY